jgi:hypothetical protein
MISLFALIWSAHADVVVNEAMINPDGADTGLHWVELYNNGSSAVDLDGWVLERAKSSWDLSVDLSGTIAPGEWFVITEGGTPGDLTVPLLDFGNATSSADAIRLVDASGAIVDTLVYGDPNSDGWDDDATAATTLTAPSPGAGEALLRAVDGVDTDDATVDFVLGPPTPGVSNAAGSGCVIQPARLVLNEIYPNPPGTDDGLEWVELFNASGNDIDLSGFLVRAGTSSYDTQGILPSGTTIAAGGYLVVGQTAIADVDVLAPGFELGNASGNADAVQLLDCGANPVDTLVYGSANTDGWLDDLGGTASPALAPFSGRSLARVRDGVDTDDNADDFGAYSIVTPGEDNPMLLWTSGIVPGTTFTINARGAAPGDRVYFARASGSGPGPCPALLGGLCLDLGTPILMGAADANSSGVASLSVNVPASTPPSVDVYFQAAKGGADPDKSVVVLETSQ